MIQKTILLSALLALLFVMSFTQMQSNNSEETPIEEISYETHIKPITSNYCTTCHTSDDPAAGFRLETYEEVRLQAEKGKLLERINDPDNPMPMGGLMPEEERRLIMEWAKNGFLEKSTQNIVTKADSATQFIPPVIEVVDITQQGFEFLENMQGHWVGKMNLMGQDMPWFAFDYRAISHSHIHGIFEGGTMGNLFTAFFIANFKGKKTIMVRNGGVLNGIYRTSYFVLTQVKISKEESYYRFVDAYGGEQIMWIEVRFKGEDEIEFNSYTSRMGTYPEPKAHMIFTAKKMNLELSEDAAQTVGFPQNKIEKDFSEGLPLPYWGTEYATITSASYLWHDTSLPVETMATLSGDPYRIDEIPYLSSLKLKIDKQNQQDKIHVFFSKSPLTDENGKLLLEYGFINDELMNQILLFSELKEEEEFTFTYLHPGAYFITAFIDKNNDFIPSKGDVSSLSQKITIAPSSSQEVNLNKVVIKN